MTAVVEGIAEAATVLFGRELPPAVAAAAQTVLLHDLALQVIADASAGTGIPGAWLRDTRTGGGTPGEVAFTRAVRMHALALDSNDSPAEAHLGAAILPAVLATAAASDRAVSGQELLRAVAIGWQAASVLGEARLAGVLRQGLRPSAAFGPLGAATASALVSGLSAALLAHAIALALDAGPGPARTLTVGSDDWMLQLGLAAEAGVRATHLAAAGFTGALDSLDEGRTPGWHGARSPDGLVPAAGRWRIEGAHFKRFPACNILQSPLLVAERLGGRARRTARPITRVAVTLNPEDRAYPGILGTDPGTVVGAMMSASFCVATMLATGTLTRAQLVAPEPAARAVAERTEVLADPAVPPSGVRLDVWLGDVVLTDALEPAPATHGLTWDRTVALSRSRAQEARVSPVPIDALVALVDELPTAPALDGLLAAAGY